MFIKTGLFCVIAAMIFIGCSGTGTVKRTPRMLSAAEYFTAGQKALDLGDWEQAAVSFNRAMKADANFAPAYAGAAFVLATKNQPDKAVEYAEKAVKLDARSYESQFYRGRVLLLCKPDNWFDRAIHSFDEALKIKSMDEAALYFKAQVYQDQNDFEQAKLLYQKVYDLNGSFSSQAIEQVRYLDAYLAAEPRTHVGADMLLVERITRADLAALLATEFNVVQMMQRRNPNYAGGNNQNWKDAEEQRQRIANSISDIDGNPAELWIRDVVSVGAMDAYPDNTFRPDELVQRMDLALTLQNLIIQTTGNTSLYTAFLNSAPRFSDVPRSHYAYNAVSLVTEYDIMPMTATNQFDLNGTVSGMEALLALRNLENYLHNSF